MFPTIIKIGPFALRSYGLMVALGLFAALQYAVYKAKAKGIAENRMLDIVLYAVVAGLVGARLAYVLTNFGFYSRNISDIFKIWEGGLVFYGGFAAGLATIIVYIRLNPVINFWEIADILAPALSLGHVFGRLGCLLAGCCYGRPSTLPWAVKFSNAESLAPKGVCLHPTQIYEALGNLAIFLVLDRLNKTGHKRGQTVLAYMVMYGVMRYIMEFFRGDDRGPMFFWFSQGQAVSLALIAVAAVLFLLKRHETNY